MVPQVQWNVEAIKAGLAHKGWSNRELARRAGVDASLVHRILQGKRGGRPGWATVTRLAEALEVEPDTIVVEDPIVEPPPPPPEPEPWAVNEWEDDSDD
jgi:transcriptional regulator with XRE-family HTH domain